ncbi:MAG: adenylate cyclase [Solirubrobacteraceae bacterium]|nr:adenylate cyclase [Solirubrobacteraceae bacterium]
MGASATTAGVLGRAAVAEDRRALLHRIEKRTALSQNLAHLAGAFDVFVLLFFVLPPPECCSDISEHAPRNLIAGLIYMPLTMVIGTYFGKRLSPTRMAWAREGRDPTPEEQARVLHAPNWCFKLDAALWLGGVIVFAAVNASTSWDLAMHVGWTLFLGGLTTCGIAYLLLERDWRPVTELALAAGQPARPAWPRIEGRLVMAWLLATGAPVLGLITIACDGLIHDVPAADLARGTLVLAVATFAISFGVTWVTARRISAPLTAVRKALGRVQAGDLATQVRVSDGSEIGFLQSGFNSMVGGLRERERMQDLYARQVGEDVARAALADEPRLGGSAREVAVMFVDIVGSTAMALEAPPERVVARLNRFFAVVVEVTAEHGGWVNKFEGDAALCVFGAPVESEDAAGCALAAGRALQARLRRDVPEVTAAIGLSAGKAVAGWVGAAQRYEYPVIGDPANGASPRSELAKRADGRLLASEAIVKRALSDDERERWRIGEEATLRGRSTPTRVARPADALVPARA